MRRPSRLYHARIWYLLLVETTILHRGVASGVFHQVAMFSFSEAYLFLLCVVIATGVLR